MVQGWAAKQTEWANRRAAIDAAELFAQDPSQLLAEFSGSKADVQRFGARVRQLVMAAHGDVSANHIDDAARDHLLGLLDATDGVAGAFDGSESEDSRKNTLLDFHEHARSLVSIKTKGLHEFQNYQANITIADGSNPQADELFRAHARIQHVGDHAQKMKAHLETGLAHAEFIV